MAKPEDLFPFPPPQTSAPTAPVPEKKSEVPMAGGPGECGFSTQEMHDLRTMLELFRNGKLAQAGSGFPTPSGPETTRGPQGNDDPFGAAPPMPLSTGAWPAESAAAVLPPFSPVPSPSPVTESGPHRDWREPWLQILEVGPLTPAWEAELYGSLRGIVTNVSGQYEFVRLIDAVSGVIHVREAIRHGTPEQKLFALIALGDRFLGRLAGLPFAQRKELIKTIGRYLSECSDQFSFLAMEGEPYHNQHHERVDGASSGGCVVKEMRGFVVIRRNTDQIVRLGRVLT